MSSSQLRMSRCPADFAAFSSPSESARAAYAAFFLTQRARFWGSGFHVESFIASVCESISESSSSASTVLVDVGAGPYGDAGGDMSHVLTFLRACNDVSEELTVLAYEPGVEPFKRLKRQVLAEMGESVLRIEEAAGNGTIFVGSHHQRVVLRNLPLSDVNRKVTLRNQPGAGSNTASIESYVNNSAEEEEVLGAIARDSQTIHSVSSTLDDELTSHGLDESVDALIVKIE